MQKTYVTFGNGHAHTVNGKTFDKDCVAVLEAETAEAGRELAFETFGRQFCMEYPEEHFDHSMVEKYFPRGLIEVK